MSDNMSNNNWNTPLINSFTSSDTAVIQQMLRSLIAEVQRLNGEINMIKSQMASSNNKTLKPR
jgi:hypothetical protein